MLTTVVGSYPKIPNRPRPARLRQAIARKERGEITPEELARIEDEVTLEVIEDQIATGLDVISDGQVRWEDDQTYLMQNWRGVSINGLQRYLDTNTYYRQPQVASALSGEPGRLARDYRFAAANSDKPVKAIVPGPYTLAALARDDHYGSRRALVLAIAELLGHEVRALQEAGAGSIQINEPMILTCPEDFPLLAEALSLMLGGVSAETALYTWFGSIDGVYPQMLELPVDVIGIDFVSRPGNWEVLKYLPSPKKLGLGVVDGRNTRLEEVEEVAAAVMRAAEICDPDRLYVNPSCGLEYLPREVAFEKLRRLTAGVALAAESAQGGGLR